MDGFDELQLSIGFNAVVAVGKVDIAKTVLMGDVEIRQGAID